MKCPSCSHNFGYLKLELEKVKNLVEFDCPNCNTRLNNRPVKALTTKGGVYLHGSVILSALVLITDSIINDGEALSKIAVYLCLAITGLGGGYGLYQFKKIDGNLEYEKPERVNTE